MQEERSFYDKPIYQVLQYIYSIMLSNIYFLLSNIIVLVYSLMVMIEPESFSVFMFMICMIPTGPSVVALCSTMGKLIRDRECSITREYFSAYKINFKQSLLLWIIGLIGVFVCLLDYKFFTSKGNLLGVVFFAIAVYLVVIALYIFPLLSRIEVSKKTLISIALYYSIKKLPITLIKLGLIIIGFLVSSNLSIISITCLFSLICYLIMLCDNAMILEIESNMKIDVI